MNTDLCFCTQHEHQQSTQRIKIETLKICAFVITFVPRKSSIQSTLHIKIETSKEKETHKNRNFKGEGEEQEHDDQSVLQCLHAPTASDLVRSLLACSDRHGSGFDLCLHAPTATDLLRSLLARSNRHRSGLVVVTVASKKRRRGDGGAATI